MTTPVIRRWVRRVALGLVGLLVALTASAHAQAKVEIHFWHAMGGQLGDTVNELVKQFNDSQSAYEVKALRKGTYPETLTAAIAAYRQKSPPHIVQVFDVGTQTMLSSGAIYPIHQLMKDQDIAVNWADFIKPVTGYYSQDGNLYSMPFNSSSPILYYNKDAFKKAGLPDAPPATWEEVGAASKKILAAGAAKCGFTTSWPSWTMLENTFPWHDQPFATNQNGYQGLDTRLLINGEFGLKHIGQLAAWQKENIYSYGGRMGQPDPKFINGDCAMLIQSSAVIGGFKKSITQFAWGTGQLPHWGAPYTKQNAIVGGGTLWVLKGRPAAEYRGVAQFMKFISEPEQQGWWAVTTGYVPITHTAIKSLEGSQHFKKNPEQWTALSQLSATPTVHSQGVRLGNFVQIREAIESELENIFAGKKTAKEGLDAAVAKGNEILKEFAAANKP
jgi:sn-glycerol 3-phosphate transport system substrate-binding protein